jgi:hypothetical protein
MAWAYQIAGRKDGCDEILILGFALKDDPKTGAKAEKSRPDVTHEMSAYLVHPQTPIDFDTSLFLQPRVSPLTPALATVQWSAASDDLAVKMAAVRVAALIRGDFGPTWKKRWRVGFEADLGVCLHHPWMHAITPSSPKVRKSEWSHAFALGASTRRRLRLMAIVAFGFGSSVWASDTASLSPPRFRPVYEATSSDWMPYTKYEYDQAIPLEYPGPWDGLGSDRG